MPATTTAVEIIGHRGASRDAPENTMASVRLAWEHNADAVEIDVHMSSDGKIVVFHDETTKRICGIAKPVNGQTLAELQKLDAGAWKDPKWANERIPALSEVLASIPDGKRLFIEVKCGAEIVPELKRDFAASGKKPEQVVVIGFSLEAMTAVKQVLPELKVCWVIELKDQNKTGDWQPKLDEIVQKAKATNMDGVDLGLCAALDREYVQSIKQAGLAFYVWTVDKPEDALHLTHCGVDGITTNRPQFIRTQLPQVAR